MRAWAYRNTVRYGAMLPNKDYAHMNATTYFKSMSIGEIVMGVVFL